MTNLAKLEPDYTERSDRAQTKVARKLILSGWEKFRRGEAAARDVKNSTLAAVKFIRAAGLDWQAARDGQLTFNAFTQNWFEGVKQFVPPECQLDKMVYAVRVAALLEGKPKNLTIEDCRPVLQLVLFATDVLPLPKRLEEQTGSARNPYNVVVTHFQRLSSEFERYRETTPFEKWTADMLSDFVRASRPLKESVLEAEKLLATRPG